MGLLERGQREGTVLTLGQLRDIAALAGVEPGTIVEHHFSNFAVQGAGLVHPWHSKCVVQASGYVEVETVDPIPGVLQLFDMREDSCIGAYEAAKDLARLVAGIWPGRFVLVTTGDYINNFPHSTMDMETYDPHNYLYLVRDDVFIMRRSELERIDEAWRTERQAVANGQAGGL